MSLEVSLLNIDTDVLLVGIIAVLKVGAFHTGAVTATPLAVELAASKLSILRLTLLPFATAFFFNAWEELAVVSSSLDTNVAPYTRDPSKPGIINAPAICCLLIFLNLYVSYFIKCFVTWRIVANKKVIFRYI